LLSRLQLVLDDAIVHNVAEHLSGAVAGWTLLAHHALIRDPTGALATFRGMRGAACLRRPAPAWSEQSSNAGNHGGLSCVFEGQMSSPARGFLELCFGGFVDRQAELDRAVTIERAHLRENGHEDQDMSNMSAYEPDQLGILIDEIDERTRVEDHEAVQRPPPSGGSHRCLEPGLGSARR
jgi:hypothetical protein